MILIIPLRNNGHTEQLRYALRSITKSHHITECILVGGKPDWYTGTHLPHKDYTAQFKEHNIRDKVISGCATITPGTDFMFANDDHILLAPITQVYNKGTLLDTLSRTQGNGSYTRCLRNTMDKYGDVDNVDTHCPMIMNTALVGKTNFEWPEFGMGFKTSYCQENKIKSVYMEDCKVDKMSNVPAARKWFSLSDLFNVRELFNMFPEPSPFE